MKKRIFEMCICAIEQGYSFTMDKKIWIDLSVYMRLNKIHDEDLKNGKRRRQ